MFSSGEDAVEVKIKESCFCRSVTDIFVSETNLLIWNFKSDDPLVLETPSYKSSSSAFFMN